ncbi:MAG: CBS domain-containing protein [DPANN group archaeon]|nr:CBS domain-containing protein [DPANN group archaeon]
MHSDNEEIKVSEIMTKKVIVIESEKSVKEAAHFLKLYNIRGLVVVENNDVIGLVTDKDIINNIVSENKIPSQFKVKDIMTSKLFSVGPDEKISDVADKMYSNRIGRVPVIDSDDNLVGIITETDITKIVPALIEVFNAKYDMQEEGHEVSKSIRGICEDCGNISDELIDADGRWLCEGCNDSKKIDLD